MLDGEPVSKELAGGDVKDSMLKIDEQRLYKLIKLPKRGEHILQLEFLDDNAELYAFTFG